MPAKGQFKKNAKPDSVRQRKYNSKPEQKKNRAARNKANRKAGTYGNGDGKDISHKKDFSKGGSRNGKTFKESPSKNRARGGRTGGKRSK